VSSFVQDRPSIRDVACKAGVSASTVSRVLNARPDVAPATRERVLAVIEELNYHPNAQAVSLSRRYTGVVGLVVPDVITPFCTSVIESVQNTLRAYGYWMLLVANQVNPEEQARLQAEFLVELWRGRRIDGLLVLIPVEVSLGPLRAMAQEGVPSVLIDMQYDGTGLNYIAVDNYRGGYLAAEHLLRLGYRDIAILCGPHWMPVSRDRLAGYEAALHDQGVPVHSEWIVPGLGFDEETGRHAMRTLLSADRRPRAVFAASDLIAFGAMATLDEVRLRIPDDIALIGFDDIPTAATYRPPLTTVRQPLETMGRLAVEHLCRLLSGETSDLLQTTMVPEVVVRVSCGSDLPPGSR
jgi:LacI family transcriptional regulator